MLNNNDNSINEKVILEPETEELQDKKPKKEKNPKKIRKIKDTTLNVFTYMCSSFGLIVLILLLAFIFNKGFKNLSFKMLTDDYYESNYTVKMTDSSNFKIGDFSDPNKKDVYFSTVWGVGFSDGVNNEKEKIVKVTYISEKSPLKNMKITDNDYMSMKKGYVISKSSMTNEANDYIISYSKDGAASMAIAFDKATIINNMVITSGGGGIRGSLLTTLYLIIITLLIALPIGIIAAIYLHEYAKKNKFTSVIKTMIDLTAGIPSIIFGLVGAVVFIPIMNKMINSNGGSIISGALTLTIIILPTIIKTTEESLKVIPDSYRSASLALGASKTQTIMKVVLPNSISGILTATILSIGRIIGESAALIYAVGTTIKDNVALNERSSSLAVHIWTIMSGENPNYELACSISILILIVVFVLSLTVKLLSKRLNRFEVNN